MDVVTIVSLVLAWLLFGLAVAIVLGRRFRALERRRVRLRQYVARPVDGGRERGEARSDAAATLGFFLLAALIFLGLWALSGWPLP